MKNLILLCLLTLLVLNVPAKRRILNAKNGMAKTEIISSESDSIYVLIENSPFYLNVIEVEPKLTTELHTNGYFWRATEYSFVAKEDFTISVSENNLIWILAPYFTVCLVLFFLYYFSKLSRLKKAKYPILLTEIGVFTFIFCVAKATHAFHGHGYYFTLLGFFAIAWVLAYLIKKLKLLISWGLYLAIG